MGPQRIFCYGKLVVAVVVSVISKYWIYLSREKITSTVKSTVEFLQEREDFWDAFD